jgi:hypothetical protein
VTSFTKRSLPLIPPYLSAMMAIRGGMSGGCLGTISRNHRQSRRADRRTVDRSNAQTRIRIPTTRPSLCGPQGHEAAKPRLAPGVPA